MTVQRQVLPPDDTQRRALAAEVHSRPSESLETPCRVTFVAVLVDDPQREAADQHFAALFDGSPDSLDAASRLQRAELGDLRVIRECHSEFNCYTFVAAGLSPSPFSEPPVMLLPPGWLASMPGRVIMAAHAKVIAAPELEPDASFLGAHFGGNIVIGGEVGEGAGRMYTDFRIHADGFSRVLLSNTRFTPRQTGRMLQRIFDIEAYRMMALLALPLALEQARLLTPINSMLAGLAERISTRDGDDEVLLQQVSELASTVERLLAVSQSRFSACKAYAELVSMRMEELRERRLPGLQPISEFMVRRFQPAVRTCTAVSQRLGSLSERIARAGALLSTRVDIARERQNQALLESMDRRGRTQMKIQQAVEGLSLAAIGYYAVGMIGYVAKALKTAGLEIEPDLIEGVSLPLILALLVWVSHRVRRRAIAEQGSD